MIKDTVDKVKRLIGGRSYAYKMTFNKENPWAGKVLLDLAKFCRAHESAFDSDPRIHAAMEGRREVFLRIQRYCNLSEQELIDLHSVKHIPKGE